MRMVNVMAPRSWIIPIIAAVTLTACSDMLLETPKGFLTTDTYYRTAADMDVATLAIYEALRNPFAGNGLGNWSPMQASDIGRHDPGETGTAGILSDFIVWDANTTNQTQQVFSPMYNVIFRANLVLAKAPDAEMSEAARADVIAEARFLRAWAYHQLMLRYSSGPQPSDLGVPLLLTEEDHTNLQMTRATQADVHAQIIEDLVAAESVLPATRDGAKLGRATKGAAQMALADLYLWRSSFMGTNEWQQASDWAKKVIDSGVYELHDSYFATFAPSNKSSNPETIFRLIGTGSRAGTGIVNTFYPRQLGFAGSPGGGFGLIKPTLWFLESFVNGDIRGNTGPQSDSVAYRTTACYTDLSRGCPELSEGAHVWKFRPSTNNLGQGDVDVIFYRYAEALLIYAEAQNELGNTAAAVEYVNMVRTRARKGASGSENRAEPADLPPGMNKQQLRDAIYMERAWELAFEGGHRWFDLVRRDSMEPGYWESTLLAHDPSPGSREPVMEHRKRFPIPGSEIDRMPSLEQNPGY